jgi:hypothetical protein
MPVIVYSNSKRLGDRWTNGSDRIVPGQENRVDKRKSRCRETVTGLTSVFCVREQNFTIPLSLRQAAYTLLYLPLVDLVQAVHSEGTKGACEVTNGPSYLSLVGQNPSQQARLDITSAEDRYI